MPYEDDYKMWLEKMLIEMNPDWVCDEMSNNEFTHNWCHQYCGEEDAYITPKCLHMFYHHIARGDRKTEQTEPQIVDWKDEMWTEAIVTEPQTEELKQTDCPWK